MRISSKGEYGLRALLDLAQHDGKDPVPSAHIAARQQIPEAYLNHLLLLLRQRGLVRSVRGPQGGYALARSPEQITLADAVLALEGTYSPIEARGVPVTLSEPVEAEILRDVWQEVEATIGEMLAATTLDELCQRKLAHERRIMYYI